MQVRKYTRAQGCKGAKTRGRHGARRRIHSGAVNGGVTQRLNVPRNCTMLGWWSWRIVASSFAKSSSFSRCPSLNNCFIACMGVV